MRSELIIEPGYKQRTKGACAMINLHTSVPRGKKRHVFHFQSTSPSPSPCLFLSLENFKGYRPGAPTPFQCSGTKVSKRRQRTPRWERPKSAQGRRYKASRGRRACSRSRPKRSGACRRYAKNGPVRSREAVRLLLSLSNFSF